MATFKRLPHQLHVADTLETVIRPAIGEIDEIWHEIALDFFWVDKVRYAELFSERFASRIDIDPDDHIRASHACALDHVQADAAEAKHNNICSRLYFRCVDHCTDTGRDAAA